MGCIEVLLRCHYLCTLPSITLVTGHRPRPEFSHLQNYDPPPSTSTTATVPEKSLPLKQQAHKLIQASEGSQDQKSAKLKALITDAFLAFLSNLVGWGKDSFDTTTALAMYGIDSLNGVSCQYWFHRGTH